MSGMVKEKNVYLWHNTLCSTYLIDLKKMENIFRLNGWKVSKDPQDADLVVLGSCGSFMNVIEDFERKYEEVCEMKKRVAIYGCLPLIAPEKFRPNGVMAKFDFFIPATNPEMVEKIFDELTVKWNDLKEPGEFRLEDYRNYRPERKFVVVQKGCSATCTFCPHKVGIGPHVSREKNGIIDEIRGYIRNGAKIIFIEGRDTGSWGTDLAPKQNFGDLLNAILSLDGDFEVHINQLGGNWLVAHGDELVTRLKSEKITNVHIPIQTVSPRLLRLMGRDERIAEMEPYLMDLKKSSRKMLLRTDIIIGFPTETMDELKATLEFVSKLFDEVACHGFELHPNTEIARQTVEFFDRAEIDERIQYALDYFAENYRGVIHRGGQDSASLVAREHKIKEICLSMQGKAEKSQ